MKDVHFYVIKGNDILLNNFYSFIKQLLYLYHKNKTSKTQPQKEQFLKK